MTALPTQLRGAFAEVDEQAIRAWWDGLSDDSRGEIARLCDERLESCFFGVVAEERDQIVPKVRGGRFAADDDAWGFDEWGPSYFDHLLEHPELVLVWDNTERAFHTGCIRHADARACWSKAAVPKDFACPFATAECLMHPLRGRRIEWRGTSRNDALR